MSTEFHGPRSTVQGHLIPPAGPGTRREFLKAGVALGAMGLPALGQEMPYEANRPQSPRPPMFPAKAKAVIFLLHQGGLSQVDSFDPKPELDRHHGKKLTSEILKGVGEIKAYFGGNAQPLLRSPFKFARHGQCGKWVSDIFPEVATCVDDLAFVHSLYNDINNHAPAMYQINTGSIFSGYPSMGAWVTYALGSENPDLPGYVVMTESNALALGGPGNWGAGFLPAAFQGTLLRSGGTPILDLNPPADLAGAPQRGALDFLDALNRRHLEARPGETELEARRAAYELAYRMQQRTPEIMDISREPEETRKLYGVGHPDCDDLAGKCLIARRLVERGVRFVQIYSGSYKCGDGWDAHGSLSQNHRKYAARCDRPFAALLRDLKRTGLLSQTLVICASEFGRLPISQGNDGRDHNPGVQTCWLAGAGVKPGVAVGASDEVGYKAAESPFHFRDLHATMLHLLGLDDMKLTYYFNGRHQRLTENGGQIIKGILV